MKRLFLKVVLSLSMLGVTHLASSAEQGTADEAVAMVKKAVIYLKTNGKTKAIEEASNSKGKFVDRDLYLTIYDMNGVVLAHGVNPRIIGKDLSDLRDADNKLFIKEILAKASSTGTGWVDYKWINPVSKEIQAKSAYFERFDGVIIASGFYKK